MNILKKIGKCIIYILIVGVILFAVNNVLTKSDKFFNIIGFRSYTILTGSMEPEIKPGDLAIVKAANINNLDIDDVITFKYEGYTVTHRIVERNESGFITKGDNNNVEDKEVVSEKDIIGKVVAVVPKLGFIVVLLSKPIVIVLALVMLALLILKDTFLEDKYSEEIKS